jgi:phenylpyruvate tautomerase PptA (4-oxalocrotonate tautomerase family)
MPHIFVQLPQHAFPGEVRHALAEAITNAACHAEKIPANAQQRFWCWVLMQDMPASDLHCGGQDVSTKMLPCMVRIICPAGVLDDAMKQTYVERIQDAFKQCLPTTETRMLAISVILEEIPEGHWGVNGTLWHLADFAKAAGFGHLQHLTHPRSGSSPHPGQTAPSRSA